MNGSFKWESLKKMSNKVAFATPLIYEDFVYVIGGCDEKGTPIGSCEYYEPAKRRWHRINDMPTKRASPAAAVIGEKIVVIGGVGLEQQPVSAVETLDLKTKEWTVVEQLTKPLLGLSCVVRGKLIL